MGNAPSTPTSASPSGVHKSLRTKKRSLDLPDLQLDMHRYVLRSEKSQSIPIPRGEDQVSENDTYMIQPSHHIERGVKQMHYQALDLTPPPPEISRFPSFQPNAPPPSRTPTSASSSSPFVVRSSIPMVELPETDLAPQRIEPADGQVLRKISWHGGGNSVFIARAEDDSSTRRLMDREDEMTFSTTVPFSAGKHHIRFLVDGQWRVADHLQTTVDDMGNLSNYVTVEIPPQDVAPSPESHSPPLIVTSQPNVDPRLINLGRLGLGHSFWSASSDSGEHELIAGPSSAPMPKYVPRWTTEIPLELYEAAKEEEVYLAHAEEHERQRQRGNDQTVHQDGFVTLPNIPPAPRLPRYLDKLILNQSPIQTMAQESTSQERREAHAHHQREKKSTRDRERQRDRDNDKDRDRERKSGSGSRAVHPTISALSSALPVTTASGTDVAAIGIRAAAERAERSETERMVPVAEAIEGGPVSPSAAAIALATIADDAAVLPIPSHVVLHHLCTSAIKHGVLAVGSTVRYRKKFLTTVYYKSANPS